MVRFEVLLAAHLADHAPGLLVGLGRRDQELVEWFEPEAVAVVLEVVAPHLLRLGGEHEREEEKEGKGNDLPRNTHGISLFPEVGLEATF